VSASARIERFSLASSSFFRRSLKFKYFRFRPGQLRGCVRRLHCAVFFSDSRATFSATSAQLRSICRSPACHISLTANVCTTTRPAKQPPPQPPPCPSWTPPPARDARCAPRVSGFGPRPPTTPSASAAQRQRLYARFHADKWLLFPSHTKSHSHRFVVEARRFAAIAALSRA
jgi:hypothetical protein